MKSFKLPTIYPIVTVEDFEESKYLLELIIGLNAGIIQLRDKSISAKNRLNELGAYCLSVKKRLHSKTIIIINDHVDIASALNVDGVHLGKSDMDPLEAREILGPNAIIGHSCNNLEDLENASKIEAIDYLGIGPIFDSSTKSGHAPTIGLEGLRSITKNGITLPLVAIGGINFDNKNSVLECGVQSVAMSQAVKERILKF